MGFLPTSLGLRPRLAVEIRPEGVVAARSDDERALVSSVSSALWSEGTLLPGLKPGNIVARAEAVAAVRKALEAVALKEREASLILPDAAVRVLLLDFDALPAKATEALPIVRFRLKKLLPFDADDAVISYQVMSQTRSVVRVLAVAVPRGVLSEYEGLVREAGFEPGCVLSSTLAVCAGLDEDVSATLLVNAGESAVTTAIVQGGMLLLHRTVDLAAEGLEEQIATAKLAGDVAYGVPPELLANTADPVVLPLDPFVLPLGETAGVMDDSGFENTLESRAEAQARLRERTMAAEAARRQELLPAQPTLAQREQAIAAREITQAVSVAAAYFEDTLQTAPGVTLAAGTLGADALGAMLRSAGFDQQDLRVIESVDPAMLTAGASTTRIAPGWLAGVRGALRS